MGELTQISQLIGGTLATCQNQQEEKYSETQRLSFNNDFDMYMTLAEATEHGFILGVEEGYSKICKFCGNVLPAIYRRSVLRKVLIDFWGHKRCRCDESVEQYEKDLEEKQNAEAEQRELEEKQKIQQRVNSLFTQSKLGERFKTRTFENFKITNSNKNGYEVAKKFESDLKDNKDGVGLNFMGSYGTGKTHLAAAIAISLINKGIPVIFGTLINLLGKIKATYDNNSGEDEEAIIRLYSTVDLLVIDDLGKEKPSEWVLEKLYTIINQRYENYKPIVITTNYDADKLIERLTVRNNCETAEAIVSRLHEMCKWVVLVGEDHRK